jgi:hypothetical protein
MAFFMVFITHVLSYRARFLRAQQAMLGGEGGMRILCPATAVEANGARNLQPSARR